MLDSTNQEEIRKKMDRLVGRGKPEQAIAFLEKTISETPENWYAHYLLGWTLQHSRNYSKAEAAYATALALAPEEIQLKAVAGEFYLGVGSPEKALPLLEASVEQWPDNAQAHALLGKALVDLEQYEKAEAALEMALELSDENPDARSEMVRLYELTGRSNLVEQFLASYLSNASDLPGSHVLVADYTFYDLGDCAAALALYETGLRLYEEAQNKKWFTQFFSTMTYPDSIRRSYLDALLECDLAESALSIAARYPGKGQFEALQAQVLEREGKYEAAIKQIRKALKRQPSAYQWTYQLGRLHLAKREFEEAERLLFTAAQSAKQHGDPDAWIDGALIVCLDMLDQATEAASLRLNVPRYRTYRLFSSLANHYLLVEEWDKATQVCEEILAEHENDINALKVKAQALEGSHNWDESSDAYSQLAELQPRNGRHMLSLAKVQGLAGRPDLAALSCSAAIESNTLSAPQIKSARAALERIERRP